MLGIPVADPPCMTACIKKAARPKVAKVHNRCSPAHLSKPNPVLTCALEAKTSAHLRT